MFRLLKVILRLNIKRYIPYIQPEDGFQEPKHVALLFFIFLSCIFIMLLFFYQQMHLLFNI